MEELSSSLGLQCPKPNSPSQMNMQPFNNLSAPSMEVINPSVNGMISTEGFYTHQSQHPIATTRNVPHLDSLLHFFPSNHGCNNTANMTNDAETMVNSSPSASGVALGIPTKNHGGKKRKRGNEREMEKPREVVHVRARRGQATDSHSLAERLRREKINEKMRCLQDLVPGCYKTMGMAVMLDVIINYVRSLQKQIDFISMKLSAASLYYDFSSSEAEAIETLQGTTGYEAIPGMDKVVGEGYNHGGISHFQTSWPPL